MLITITYLSKFFPVSLAEAQTKLPRVSRMSDLLSAEEITTSIKRKKKSASISPDTTKLKYIKSENNRLLNTCPQFHYSSFVKKK